MLKKVGSVNNKGDCRNRWRVTCDDADRVVGDETPFVARHGDGGLHANLVADFYGGWRREGGREAKEFDVYEADPVRTHSMLPIYLK